ncbi:ATP-binding cassette domain-containing protein [Lactococcus termiticola]|uniref:Spermidine/putrescine ABC transporter ATP-binding protein n=1 Tax=Lactococcus termiticola TaxID=2169526 RepID=A0A2R5HF97_9LACT|nr:ATP-binding cassette domain-containing protein [Lactococcus termiticola]GBG96714.1 spermidine/putrescine ABC transporter ATP-binding protein [Lactococcus termiticola]
MSLSVKIHHQLYPERLDFEAELDQLITGISAPSGAGKTTILNIIAGLTRADQAEISFQGQVWEDRKAFVPAHKRNLAYVMQEVALFPNMNVLDNVAFSRRTKEKASLGEDLNLIEKLAQELSIEAFLHQPIQKLSGGQKQRVALARALYSQPSLLLLDEPFNGLDEATTEQSMALIKGIILEAQIPTLIVSHRKSELEALCDDIISITKKA